MFVTYIRKLRRNKLNLLISIILVSGVIFFTGVHEYIFAIDFDEQFDYPLKVDIKPLVQEVLSGKQPSVTPINYYPYRFLSNSGICDMGDKIDLFLVIKSAMKNFGHRTAIRQTYATEVVPGKSVKFLFFIGTHEPNDPNNAVQRKINFEMEQHKDIIQIDFKDDYYNNTIKTMSSFRWLYEHCSSVDFYFFTDDDMYVSVKNIFKYIEDLPKSNPEKIDLYAGHVLRSRPLRVAWSKWRVSLEEYPWSRWPPYVTAMGYLLSNKSMKKMYAGSLFVKHFRFDDIYLSIIAYKVGITPIHCSQFYFYKKPYDKEGYKNVIVSHGFNDHNELIRVWNDQNDM